MRYQPNHSNDAERDRPDMPEQFRQIDRDWLEIRRGGGWMSLFGLPFLAVGLFVLGIALELAQLSDALRWSGDQANPRSLQLQCQIAPG
jgi:hypothetical protein